MTTSLALSAGRAWEIVLPRRWRLAVILGAVAAFAAGLWRGDTPSDYAINWTAANALRRGLPLSDADGLRALGMSLVGEATAPIVGRMFGGTFTSCIGPPSTALLYLPFTALPFWTGLAVYRAVTLVGMAAAVVIAGLSLPVEDRLQGWMWGTLALASQHATPAPRAGRVRVTSAVYGQVDAWIMLGLAAAVFGASRGNWWIAGLSAGVAALLKISPALVVAYCLLHGKWQVALGAALVGALALAGAAAIGRPGDLWIFLTGILPRLSQATLAIENQSLAAWLARLVSPETDLRTLTPGGLGVFRFLPAAFAAAALAALWGLRGAQLLAAVEIGLMIIVALLTGPLTWDRYFSWAAVSLVTLAQGDLWRGLTADRQSKSTAILALGGVLITMPLFLYWPDTIAAQPALRLATGTQTLGALVWLGTGIGLLAAQTGTMPARAAVSGR